MKTSASDFKVVAGSVAVEAAFMKPSRSFLRFVG
jgi:hypothetical protein